MAIETFGEYWYSLQRNNRALNDDANKMTITVESFKKQMKLAFTAGKLAGQHGTTSKPGSSFLDDLMGGRM